MRFNTKLLVAFVMAAIAPTALAYIDGPCSYAPGGACMLYVY